MSENHLIAAVVEAARRLPHGQIGALARSLERLPEATPAVRGRLLGLVPTPTFGEAASKLFDAWTRSEGLSGGALSLALEAASKAVEEEGAEESIEIVWTGPQSPEVPLRLTREALVDVIRTAQQSLIVVSFAAYKVEIVVRELAAAAARGVKVRLILEQEQSAGGGLTFGAADAFKDLGDAVKFYIWPTVKRPVLERGRAALHAKAAIADDQTAFVTSANLTGHAISENMELGLLIRGGPVPRRLAAHFNQLLSDRVLEEVLP